MKSVCSASNDWFGWPGLFQNHSGSGAPFELQRRSWPPGHTAGFGGERKPALVVPRPFALTAARE
ncbi:hypothetical protein ABIA03_000056 [Bradyrhizobium yuanmingense]